MSKIKSKKSRIVSFSCIKRLTAYLLFFSYTLIGCLGVGSSSIKKGTSIRSGSSYRCKKTSNLFNNKVYESANSQHIVQFFYNKTKLKARVEWNLPSGFRKSQICDVESIEKGLDLNNCQNFRKSRINIVYNPIKKNHVLVIGSFGLKGGMKGREQEKGILNQLLSEQGIQIEGLDKAIIKCKKNINRYKNRPNKLKDCIAKLEKLNEIKKIINQIEDSNMENSNPNDPQGNDDIHKYEKEDDESQLKQLLDKAGIQIEQLEKAIAKCKKNINRSKKRPNKLKKFITEIELLTKIENLITKINSEKVNIEEKYHDKDKIESDLNNSSAFVPIEKEYNNNNDDGKDAPFTENTSKYSKDKPTIKQDLESKNLQTEDEKLNTSEQNEKGPLFDLFYLLDEDVDEKDYLNEISNMPQCSEKSVLMLIQKMQEAECSNTLLKGKSDFLNDVKEIKSGLIEESSFKGSMRYNIQSLTDSIQSEDWGKTSEFLNKILGEVRPLDIYKTIVLTKKCIQESKKTKGQHILMLIGSTGDGKTTAIHHLCGSKFRVMYQGGVKHYEPYNVPNPILNEMHTSASSKSTTRYISVIPIDLCEIDEDSSIEKIYLCDTPGFGDSCGSEVDISNGVGILEAVKNSESVRLALFISKKNAGGKFEKVKPMLHMLNNMIEDVQKHKNSINYIFNFFNKDEIVKEKKPNIDQPMSEIYARLRNLQKVLSPNEKNNYQFFELIKSLKKKAEVKINTVDLEGGNRKKLIESLIESDGIYEPKRVFRFSVKQESRAALRNEIGVMRLNIISAIKKKRYDVIKYRMDNLKELNGYLKDEELSNVYNTCLETIVNDCKTSVLEKKKQFNKCLLDQNSLTLEDVVAYRNLFEEIQSINSNFNGHTEKDMIDTSILTKNLLFHANKMLKSFFAHEKEEEKSSESENDEKGGSYKKILNIQFLNQAQKNKLDKVKFLAGEFLEVKELYKKVQKSLSLHFNNLVVLGSKVIKIGNTELFLDVLKAANYILSSFKEHISKIGNKNNEYENLKKKFLDKLNSKIAKSSELLEKKRLSRDSLTYIKEILSQLKVISEDYRLYSYFDETGLKSYYLSLKSKIVESINTLMIALDDNKVTSLLMEQLEGMMQKIVDLRGISEEIDRETSRNFYGLLGKVKYKVRAIYKSAEETFSLQSYDIGDTKFIKYNSVTDALDTLNQAKWIDALDADLLEESDDKVCQELIQKIHASISSYVKGIEEYVYNLADEVNINSDSEFDKLNNAIVKLDSLKVLGSYMAKVEPKMLKIKETYFDAINGFLKMNDFMFE